MKPKKLREFHLVELEGMTYSDIKGRTSYTQENFDSMFRAGNKYYLVEINYFIESIEAHHDMWIADSEIIPIYYVISREKFLLYRTLGVL